MNTDGSLDASFDPGSRAANVTALAWQADGKVVFSGNFTNLDGIGATNLARLNADGSLDTNFCAAASTDNAVNSLVAQPDGRILLSGWFASVNRTPRSGIARLNADGMLDTSFDPGTGLSGVIFGGIPGLSYPTMIALQPDGLILVWGNFIRFNDVTRRGVARLTPTGGLDASFNPDSDWFRGRSPGGRAAPYVKFVAFLANGRFLTGGSSSPYSMHYLNRCLPDGTPDGWMNECGTDGGVMCLTRQSDGKVAIGGHFDLVNGVGRTNLARMNADGSLDTGFTANTSGFTTDGDTAPVSALGLQSDGKLVVGGSFTAINGIARTNLARLNTDGSVDAGFAANVGSPDYSEVVAIVLQPDGKVLVGGLFEDINGVAVTNLARLNPDGSVDTTFQIGTGPDHEVLAPRAATGWYDSGRRLVQAFQREITDMSGPFVAGRPTRLVIRRLA